MKKWCIVLGLLVSSSLVFGHCGTCGTGASKHEKKATYSKKYDRMQETVKGFGLTAKKEKKKR